MPLGLLQEIGPVAAALCSIGPALRVAIVADLVSIAGSAEAATTLAQQLAMFPQPVIGLTDFSVQMNLRMPYPSAKGEQMNRLLRWATATFQVLRFQVSGGSGAINPLTELSHAASVRMDVNSAPSSRLLDPQQQVAMYSDMQDEIARLAVEPTLTRLLVNNAQ
ncbi:hypothetical protein ASC68_00895 [Devosia sp. Root105]|nr:hypothetical protein ASC68_00895 [Devosia sp. Root105]